MKKFVATFLVVAMIIPATGCGLAKRVLNHFMPKQGILSATPEPYQLNPYADFSNIDGAKTIYNDDGTVTVIVNGEAITYSMDENGSYSVIYVGTPAPNTEPTAAPTPVTTIIASATPMYVTGNDVRVRTAPSTEASYFAHVSKGTMVYAYEQTNGFYRVMLTDGTEAYIMAKYLSTTPTTPDPTPVPTNVKVVDALIYKKPIVQYIENETGIHIDPNPTETKYHVIIVPKITDDSDAAKAINIKMYGNIQGIYNSLLNNREDTEIYGADYAYINYNGIIGISQKKYMGGQFQGGADFFYFYYYDSVNKKELTFDEYLSLLGISRSDFSKLKNDDGTPIYEEWLPNITNGIFDTNGGQFYVLFPDSPDGGMAFKTSTNLLQ